jgi:(1->4)-alpha-D-glucan 1-alpha-D-glucosylmutase
VREAAIANLAARHKTPDQRPSLFKTLMGDWQDGRVKQATIALLLALRRDEPDLFSAGDYQPLVIEGDRSDWAFGYLRASGDRKLAVVMARYPAHREAEPEWNATARLPEGRWFDLFRGREAPVGAPLHEWLHPLPFAVLVAQ